MSHIYLTLFLFFLPEILPEHIILKIGDDTIRVEVSVTPEERRRGLMYRDTIGEDEGMLFVFEEEDYLSFWMKNTPLSLSIAFIDRDGVILEILDMEPLSEVPIVSSKPALYALEMKKGWFISHNVSPGDTLQFIFFNE